MLLSTIEMKIESASMYQPIDYLSMLQYYPKLIYHIHKL